MTNPKKCLFDKLKLFAKALTVSWLKTVPKPNIDYYVCIIASANNMEKFFLYILNILVFECCVLVTFGIVKIF